MPKIYVIALLAGNINSLQFKEQSGLVIQSLKLTFYGKRMPTKKLYLKTPQTIIKDELLFWYFH
jgi:hypothetical protein